MSKLKQLLIALASLVAIVAVTSVTIPRQTQAQKARSEVSDVNVVNTPTVNAQQGGVWNVNLAGTPNVELAPNSTVGINPNNNVVQIANNQASPLNVSVGVPAGEYYTTFTAAHLDPGDTSDGLSFDPLPTGKRLFIEQVSCSAEVNEGQRAMISFTTLDHSFNIPRIFSHFLALNEQGTFSGREHFRVFEPMKLEVGGHLELIGGFRRNGSLGSASCTCTITGRLINNPASPPAAN